MKDKSWYWTEGGEPLGEEFGDELMTSHHTYLLPTDDYYRNAPIEDVIEELFPNRPRYVRHYIEE